MRELKIKKYVFVFKTQRKTGKRKNWKLNKNYPKSKSEMAKNGEML
jgi:hypothetical protein